MWDILLADSLDVQQHTLLMGTLGLAARNMLILSLDTF
jgi:hypothetical protein